jgi:hypothetical protein
MFFEYNNFKKKMKIYFFDFIYKIIYYLNLSWNVYSWNLKFGDSVFEIYNINFLGIMATLYSVAKALL